MTHAKRPVLIAPDKFRGTLSAAEVAAAIARGLARAEIAADICGIADGGEGTIEVLRAAGIGAGREAVEVSDALGRQTSGRILMLDAATALVQSADAIGLQQLAEAERDAVAASSRGAGELIAAAAERGARHVLVGIGGTASSDGGAGAVELLREYGLVGVRGPLRRCPKITALCDVRAAYEQAVPIFAPQKGASADEVAQLDAGLRTWARVLEAATGRDVADVPGAGAAGGTGAAAMAVLHAELVSGAGYVQSAVGLADAVAAADLVVTGEGHLDEQSLLGKGPVAVARIASSAGVPVIAVCGRISLTADQLRDAGFAAWSSVL